MLDDEECDGELCQTTPNITYWSCNTHLIVGGWYYGYKVNIERQIALLCRAQREQEEKDNA